MREALTQRLAYAVQNRGAFALILGADQHAQAG